MDVAALLAWAAPALLRACVIGCRQSTMRIGGLDSIHRRSGGALQRPIRRAFRAMTDYPASPARLVVPPPEPFLLRGLATDGAGTPLLRFCPLQRSLVSGALPGATGSFRRSRCGVASRRDCAACVRDVHSCGFSPAFRAGIANRFREPSRKPLRPVVMDRRFSERCHL
jgi:hypothetical protein